MIGCLPGDFTGYADQTGEQFLRLIGSLRVGVDWATVTRLADRFDVDEYLQELPAGLREMFAMEQMSTGPGFLEAELFTLALP